MLNDLQIFLDGQLIDETEVNFENALAVLQDETSDKVISIFEINQESFLQSIKTNKFYYFNRQKNSISTFGLLDGNFASISKIYIQKDPVNFLFKVKTNLPKSLFNENLETQKTAFLDDLVAEISQEKQQQNLYEIYQSFSKNSQNLILENVRQEINPSIQKLRIKEFIKALMQDLFLILSKNGLNPEDLKKEIPKI